MLTSVSVRGVEVPLTQITILTGPSGKSTVLIDIMGDDDDVVTPRNGLFDASENVVAAFGLPNVLAGAQSAFPGLTALKAERYDSANSPIAYFGEYPINVDYDADSLAGLIRIAMHCEAARRLLLLDNVDAGMHPSVLRFAAKCVFAAATRGIQAIVATNSLEWIDALRFHAARQMTSVVRTEITANGFSCKVLDAKLVEKLREDRWFDLR